MDTLLQPKNVVKTKMRSGGTLNSGGEKTHLITNSRKEDFAKENFFEVGIKGKKQTQISQRLFCPKLFVQ